MYYRLWEGACQSDLQADEPVEHAVQIRHPPEVAHHSAQYVVVVHEKCGGFLAPLDSGHVGARAQKLLPQEPSPAGGLETNSQ